MKLYGDVKGVYNIGELIHHYKNTRIGSFTGEFTASGAATIASPQVIWESRIDTNDYTGIYYNGVMVYCKKAKAGFVTEYICIAGVLVPGSVHTYQLDALSNFTLLLYLDGIPSANGFGSEIISVLADRNFSSDTGYWGKEAGVTISGGFANWAASNGTLYHDTGPALGKAYYTSYVMAVTSGSMVFVMGGNSNPIRSETGNHYDANIVAGSIAFGYRGVGSYTGTVDNVSLKEIFNSTSSTFPPVITGSYSS